MRKLGVLGYVANDETFIFLKYTTKSRSPWVFNFDQEDVDRCFKMANEFKRLVFGFICGGDGVCSVNWHEAKQLLGGKPGRIVAARKHNHSYSVWGTVGELKRKVSVNRWPAIMFESNEQTGDNIGEQ